jgi:hypothetical protein
MAKYGNVIECRGGKQISFEVNDPAQKNTLSCEKDAHDDANATLLRAGTEKNQRIVAVQTTDKGTEFTIIRIENSLQKHESL